MLIHPAGEEAVPEVVMPQEKKSSRESGNKVVRFLASMVIETVVGLIIVAVLFFIVFPFMALHSR